MCAAEELARDGCACLGPTVGNHSWCGAGWINRGFVFACPATIMTSSTEDSARKQLFLFKSPKWTFFLRH